MNGAQHTTANRIQIYALRRLRIRVIFFLIDIEIPHNELKCGQFYIFSVETLRPQTTAQVQKMYCF